MKQILTVTLACITCFFTACDDAATSDKLPAGTAPNAQQPNTPTDPATTQAGIEQTPEPAVQTPARESAPGISWVRPAGWSRGPEKQMRLATLLPPDEFASAELAIAQWPGDVGGFDSNVVRWAGQVGLQLDPTSFASFQLIEVAGAQATYIPLINKDLNKAILTYWVPLGENPDEPTQTWTFKLTCSADQVEKLEPAFKAWAASVKFD